MLTHYLDAGNFPRLFENHADLVDADFDYPIASARLAGRDASELLHRHGDHSQPSATPNLASKAKKLLIQS